jgi:hypothetical protein
MTAGNLITEDSQLIRRFDARLRNLLITLTSSSSTSGMVADVELAEILTITENTVRQYWSQSVREHALELQRAENHPQPGLTSGMLRLCDTLTRFHRDYGVDYGVHSVQDMDMSVLPTMTSNDVRRVTMLMTVLGDTAEWISFMALHAAVSAPEGSTMRIWLALIGAVLTRRGSQSLAAASEAARQFAESEGREPTTTVHLWCSIVECAVQSLTAYWSRRQSSHT